MGNSGEMDRRSQKPEGTGDAWGGQVEWPGTKKSNPKSEPESQTTLGVPTELDRVGSGHGVASNADRKGFLSKLVSGDFGLAKTFWVFWVPMPASLVALASYEDVLIPRDVSSSVYLALTYFVVLNVYSIPVMVGTWRAANKFQGAKLWAILAKLAIVMSSFFALLGLAMLLILKLLGMLPGSLKEAKKEMRAALRNLNDQ